MRSKMEPQCSFLSCVSRNCCKTIFSELDFFTRLSRISEHHSFLTDFNESVAKSR